MQELHSTCSQAERLGAVGPGMVLNELWGIADPREAQPRAASGEGLRSKDVAEAILFMLTRPRNLVMLLPPQDLSKNARTR